MKANQKGFSVVEILIVIVVVGLLGAVGWLVYDRQKSKTSNTSNTQVDTPQKEEKSKQEVTPYEGWQSFNNSKLKFAFQYPLDWKAEIFDENGLFSVTLIAPRTTTSDEGYEEVINGAKIYTNCPNAAFTSLHQFKQESSIYTNNATNKSKVIVNGADAEQYVVGYEGPENRITTFIVGKQICDVAIQESVYKKAEFGKVYDLLVRSITF